MTYSDIKEITYKKIQQRKDDRLLSDYEKRLNNASGIYAIVACDVVVYIGKSRNLLARIMEHLYMISHPDDIDLSKNGNMKYKILNKVYNVKDSNGLRKANIVPLLIQESKKYCDDYDLSMLEALYIRKYLPYFNIQIPNADGTIDYCQNVSYNEYDFVDWIISKLNE